MYKCSTTHKRKRERGEEEEKNQIKRHHFSDTKQEQLLLDLATMKKQKNINIIQTVSIFKFFNTPLHIICNNIYLYINSIISITN